MSTTDMLGAIAHLPDDAQVTLTVRKRDLVRALESRAGGPATITTTQAEQLLGYDADQWRRWCVAGKIPGAWQDADGGPWRMPRTACEARLAKLQKRAGAAREPKSHRPMPRGPRGRAGHIDAADASPLAIAR